MKPKYFHRHKLVVVFKKSPIWFKIIAAILLFSVIIVGYFWTEPTFSTIFAIGPVISLRDFESRDQSYRMKLPIGWMLYESREGIHGDPYLIAQTIEGSLIQPVFDIAKIEMPDADLSQVVTWGQERAMEFPNTTMNSISQHNTALYDGVLLIYTIPEAGYEKREMECHDWVTYTKPYGYVIRLCTIPRDWKRLDVPFQKMIASFAVTNE